MSTILGTLTIVINDQQTILYSPSQKPQFRSRTPLLTPQSSDKCLRNTSL